MLKQRGQAFKNIPSTMIQNAETKTVKKSNTLSNNTIDQVDSTPEGKITDKSYLILIRKILRFWFLNHGNILE